MNILRRVFGHKTGGGGTPNENLQKNLTENDFFSNFYSDKRGGGDAYLLNAWVNIAVNILTRNIARADFIIKKNGDDVTGGCLYDLFRRPNKNASRFDLWKETAGWWFLEGEAFWWFGPDYSGGLPHEIYILNPRRMQAEPVYTGGVYDEFMSRRRWFYQSGGERIPILSDELVHFRDWNP